MAENGQPLSPNKQALLKIRELKQQLAEAKDVTSEPIAIVSMACRFPKSADTPEKFWDSLIQQEDLVTDVPGDRWELDAFVDDDPDVPGKMYARRGVFLENVDQMDPEFFGISPREATWVDPQQRLLMEVGWEAIERAGWIPEKISARTGVFVGWMHNDYQNEASDSFLNLNPYIATGAAGSFLPGRLAHCLGLQGPSIAVDTACSSSLVALHLAIQSLQRRDCDRALAGGVNAICSPTTNILTCKLKALSPSGHSRAFDAAADGYLRGEGCGVVTLKRLADAKQDGDSILGIIRGSAVGHNGGGAGLTVPNPKAQEQVIREALQRSGLDANEIDYLEAHGTGTELGDPIEVNAASAAYCETRTQNNPLLIGSVKTNIGHLEAAAGMAGLIKVLLAIQKGSIPGQMNFETPNPHIPWDKIPVKVLTKETPWPDPERRIAGVSAFGMSGTNAHVVVEAPASEFSTTSPVQLNAPKSKQSVITLSAKSDDALAELADAYADSIAELDSDGLDAFSAQSNIRRSHFDHRAAVIANNPNQVEQSLRTLSRGGTDEKLVAASFRRRPKVAWVFTGQGAQYIGMGRQLYETESVYRQAIDQCDLQLKSLRNESLLEILFQDSSTNPAIDDTHWTQPAIFSLQMGLAKLLQSWNLQPDVVLGHSVGQYAAACVAGIMSWEDGLKLIAERGRLIGQLPSGGQMLAVFAPEEAVRSAISNEKNVSLAALNGTHNVASGDSEAIDRIEEAFFARNIRCKKLKTSHAFHSHLMDPVLEPFSTIAGTIQFQRPRMPLICNVSGKVLSVDEKLDGDYWANHIRQPVSFAPSINALNELNCDLLVELGPQAVLTRMAMANWAGASGTVFSCLEKNGEDNQNVAKAVARMYVHGLDPDFREFNQELHVGPNLLPTYPFQRRRFWGPAKPRAEHSEFHTAHPLLGGRISLAGAETETRFESYIEPDSPAWMPDHEVMNATVLPGAALVEMAIEFAEGQNIKNIVFEQPIRPVGRTAIQSVARKTEGHGSCKFECFARPNGTQNWSRHFSCDIVDEEQNRPGRVDLAKFKTELTESDTPDHFYLKMSNLGLNYGPSFRCIRDIRFSELEVLTRLETLSDVRGYNIPPTLLDAALHSLAVGLLGSDDDSLFLPVGIGRVTCYSNIETEVWCLARWKQNEGNTRTADIQLISNSGEVQLEIEDLKVQKVSQSAIRQMSGVGAERLVFDLQWKPERLSAIELPPKKWLLIRAANQSEAADAFTTGMKNRLANQKHVVTEVLLERDQQFLAVSQNSVKFAGIEPGNWSKLFDALSLENEATPFDGVSWLIGDEKPTFEKVLCDDAQSLTNFVQSMLERQWRRLPCGLQLITRNAVAVGESHSTTDPAQTQYWGLGRVVGAEQPELRCRLLDVEVEQLNESATMDLAIDLALTETLDNQHVIRNGSLFVPRMKSTRLKSNTSFTSSSDGSYLVTGGLGMLGRQVARWLASRGAKQVVLVSRRSDRVGVDPFVEEIESLGCEAIIHAADMSSRSDVELLFKRFGDDLNSLSGIVHAAGVLDDGLIESQNPGRFEKVLRPKIAAALLLDEFSRPFDLNLFVLYSSAASVLGSPGQSNYALGNAFLDGLAAQRRAAGLPAVAINWGPWSEGMADDERILKRLSLQGITPLSAEEAHSAMDKMLANEIVQATVMDVDWRRMRIGPTGEVPPMLSELVGVRKKAKGGDSAFVSKLRSLKGNARRDLLVQTVQETFQNILSSSEAPEIDRPLIEMGLDSLMAVEFGTELQQMLGDTFNVGPTMLFDYPTIDAISDYLLELIIESDEGEAKAKSELEPAPQIGRPTPEVSREDIAIVGMSCRFPGAENVQQFWQNLLNGVDSVRDIPNDRWDIDRFYSEDHEPGKMATKQGGFLDDIADFDASFFNISDQEACWIDPQHRMLLENSYRAMEDAGIPTAPLSDSNVGVFMGIMGSDYAFLPSLDDHEIIEGFQGAGLSHSAGVGRISYIFGFEGPSVAIDTASSSSLVAVYQAMRSLQEGNCNMALAGGVNAILAPVNSLLMSKAGLLSPDGRCKSFSESANGFGRGEGCGVVVLKRLSDAERDGDRIMAVIRGGAVVHNGFSGGITSPSGKAQSRVIDSALKDAGIAPSEVQYLEAHGTGTEFGDPMEIAAAMKIYGKGRRKDEPLLIGSVKANISHLEAAGGSSGLIKTVLALHHGIIPQQIHCGEPSPHIPWKRMPGQIVSGNASWPQCERRSAGITALGLVGTNAHIVLSNYQNEIENNVAEDGLPDPDLLVISGKNETSLQQLCRKYVEHLESNPKTDLNDFCYTLATGRRHYNNRMTISFDSREDLIVQLQGRIENRGPHFGSTGDANGESVSTRPEKSAPKIAWVFDYENYSELPFLQLIQRHPIIADFVEQCDQDLREHAISAGHEFSLQAAIENQSPENETRYKQLINFVWQSSLCQLWDSWGIQADAAIGFGVGQYTAACVAGCMCYFDALLLVLERCEFSGEEMTDEKLDQFEKFADQFNFYPPNLPLVCSLSAEIVPSHRSLGGSYWRKHLADQTKIGSSFAALDEANCNAALTMGTCNLKTLDGLRKSNLDVVPSINEKVSGAPPLMTALARLYELGCNPNFDTVYFNEHRTRLSLPTYPFQKKRYWITEIAQFMSSDVSKEVESAYS